MSAPDYENAADAGMDNVYMVTVMADDGTYMAMREVTNVVTGMVTLWTWTDGWRPGQSRCGTLLERTP